MFLGNVPVRSSKLFISRAVALKRQTFIEAWKRKHFLNQVVFSAKRQHLYLWILNWCTNFKHRLLTKYYTIQRETNCSKSPIKTAFVRSIIHFCPLFHWIDYFDKPQMARLNYISLDISWEHKLFAFEEINIHRLIALFHTKINSMEKLFILLFLSNFLIFASIPLYVFDHYSKGKAYIEKNST